MRFIAAAIALAFLGGQAEAEVMTAAEMIAAAKQNRALMERSARSTGDSRTLFVDDGTDTGSNGDVIVGAGPSIKSNEPAPRGPISPPATTVAATPPDIPRTNTPNRPRAPSTPERIAPPAQSYGGDPIDLVILFEYDSAFIKPESRPQLRELCSAAQSGQLGNFYVIGHTDASGPASYNLSLSERRAREVARHLTSECDVDARKIEALGLGETELIANLDARAEAQRRVEIRVKAEEI